MKKCILALMIMGATAGAAMADDAKTMTIDEVESQLPGAELGVWQQITGVSASTNATGVCGTLETPICCFRSGSTVCCWHYGPGGNYWVCESNGPGPITP